MEHKVVTDYTNVNTQNEYLKVYVRARPPENADHTAEDMFTVGPGPGAGTGNKKVVLKVRVPAFALLNPAGVVSFCRAAIAGPTPNQLRRACVHV